MVLKEGTKKLKFGILCDDYNIQNFELKSIQHIIAYDLGDLALIIYIENTNIEKPFFRTLKQFKLREFLFSIYNGIFVNPSSRKKIYIKKLFCEIPILTCRVPIKNNLLQNVKLEDINKIKDFDLDFILQLGFNYNLGGPILNSAKYGIWSFHHDDELKYQGGPPCFWEIFFNDDITGANLSILSENQNERFILKKGFFSTKKDSYSKNINQTYYGSALWPSYVCKDILNGNLKISEIKKSSNAAKICNAPGNYQLILFLIKILINKIVFYSRVFSREIWNVGIISGSIEEFIKKRGKMPVNWIEHSYNNGNFIADPFGLSINDHNIIFFENYNYSRAKATIDYIEFSNPNKEQLKIEKSQVALKDINHFAYPYVFLYNDSFYMIPESWELKKISIYKALEFPNKWKNIKTLINGDWIDPTIFYYNDFWWIFTTLHYTTELHIFFSKELFGEWEPHKSNPVKIDIRSSRSAGTPFIIGNTLYRPAQNSSKSYGGKITVNRILELSPERFDEEIFMEFSGYYPFEFAFHTLSICGKYILIDGKRRKYHPKFIIRNIIENIYK